ncbi:hypothetical protein ACJRO7_022925 [Eucalyptus globulus]|uniref:Pectinesterase n=1 Tax=Eucalyptus globulus TaxID=34317 RepID=A0ABD3K5Y9_EUCGL
MSTLKVHILIIFFFLLSLSPNLVNTKSPHDHFQVARSTCQGALYPDLCISTLASFPDLASKSLLEIIFGTLDRIADEVRAASAHCTVMKNHFLAKLSILEWQAMDVCLELFGDILDDVASAVSYLEGSKPAARRHYFDLQSLLSRMITHVYTCTDEFDPRTDNLKLGDSMKKRLSNVSRHVANSLFFLKNCMAEGFPAWMSSKDSQLVWTPTDATKFDLVVAKDGSGNFTSINDAVAAAPTHSKTRFVIYIKEGVYFEYVVVDSTKTNLMFVGDGIGKTSIRGNRNNVDGWSTYLSATVIVQGNKFLAKGITMENFSGPSKYQAVAFRSNSEKSAFFQCSFLGYQDTLYMHSGRQFYRDCEVYGTVDFVFGNAAVVFQNCSLYARKPNDKQINVFTVQGRYNLADKTGMSFLGCKFLAAPDLVPVQSSFKTFLGRPWKEFSTTVIIKSYIDDLVDPAGWLEFNNTVGLSTLFYGEYLNSGPSSNTIGRVKWPGYKVIDSLAEASMFTVGSLIQGTQWLKDTGFPYYLGLK